MTRNYKKYSIIVFSVLVGVIVGLVVASNFSLTQNGFAGHESKQVKVNTTVPTATSPSDIEGTSRAFVAIAKKVTPAVVSITSEKVIKVKDPLSNFFHKDEFFKRFFKQPENGREYKQHGLGSGVIVSSDGYVLTNYHVVKEADEIEVVINKKPYHAEVIGTDPATDIAVIKIEKKGLSAITLGNSEQLEVGEWVLAIGSPFDLSLQHTVTSGIISAKGRALSLSGELTYQDFIQTDAAINPGNSGGALVNIHGELIGINTAIYAGNTGGNIGIGFAVPIDLARKVMDDLIQHGEVVRGYLGVYINSLDAELSEALKIDDNAGAVVTDVIEGTPADKAGIKKYDVIIAVEGKKIDSQQSLTNIIASYQPGDKVRVKMIRDGDSRDVTVVLERRPGGDNTRPSVSPSDGNDNLFGDLGFELRNMTDELARRYGYEDVQGVIIVNVENNSVAHEKGMRAGDVIVEVDRQTVRSLRQLKKIYDTFEVGQIVLFQIQRAQNNHFIAIKVPE